MTYSVRTFAQQPEVRHHIERLSGEAWPTFLLHGDVAHWHLLFEMFPEYQLLLFDAADTLVAVGHTVPFIWDGSVSDLPRTIEEIVLRAEQARRDQQTPNTLSALAAMVSSQHRGQNLSTGVIQEMKALARQRACSALILLSAISMSIAPERNALQNRVIHSIQKSDFIYWGFTRLLQSLFLQLIGIPPDVYKSFTPEQKELAQEMLNVMHPMSQRRAGSIHEFEIEPLDSATMSEISVPTLIMHARDDALVSYEHAEFAHRNITQSKLVLFDTGGHGLISRMNEAREHVGLFLSERIPSSQQ